MRSITWPAVLLLLFTLEAAAQRHSFIPKPDVSKFPPGVNTKHLQQRLSAMMHARPGAKLHVYKTTAGSERLLAEASYDYISAPGIADSIVFVYSGGRSSEFGYEYLGYDYEEANADYYPAQFGNYGFVDYDSLNYYDFSGSSNYETPGIRSYNAAGKVTKAVKDIEVVMFGYDASGRLEASTVLYYDAVSQTYDSSYRDFYFYNASGHLVKDSTESWDPSATLWVPTGTYYHTVNAAGYPTKTELVYFAAPITLVLFELDYAYNGMNQLTNTLFRSFDGTGLQNQSRDTIGYAGVMLHYNDYYRWDTAMSTWVITAEERRRMNASSLPDSVWYRIDNSGIGVWDTTTVKLTYNAQGNPVNGRAFPGNSSTASIERRWYYEPVSNVGVKPMTVGADLLAYPNPAGETLYLKGTTEGRYAIQNMAGQVLQSGTLNADSRIPVQMLPAGIYVVSLQDKAGFVRTAQFIRR